ncbi:glutathione S-transferase family protein [uncultured Methylobacterium sp.]|uniref:glutathione S-transferase family protein n=1 Tax=uncultured Methylobacterium sp. TaxID=157278 RepID=UPI0035CC64D8
MAITLYTFGPAFGLPDPSPFAMKADVLLRMSGLPYSTERASLRKSPKGKVPYLRDGDALIGDSTFIRLHLEDRHGIDFDAGHAPAERALGWAVEKMLEDQAYWAIVDARWFDDANFARGPARFFDAAPAAVRPLAKAVIRRSVRKAARAQGFGRHAKAEVERLGIRAVEAAADLLGDKPYLLGATISGSDATLYAFSAHLLCPVFDTPLRAAVEGRANLVAYVDRMHARFYPDRPT